MLSLRKRQKQPAVLNTLPYVKQEVADAGEQLVVARKPNRTLCCHGELFFHK